MSLHPLLEKQIKSSNTSQEHYAALLDDVSKTYVEADRERKRTDRTISLMIEELEEANTQLSSLVDERTNELKAVEISLEAMQQNTEQGIMIIDSNDHIKLLNKRVIEMLELPQSLIDLKPTFSQIIAYQINSDEYQRSPANFVTAVVNSGINLSPSLYERTRPNGTVLEIRTVTLKSGGAVRIFTDITRRKMQEKALMNAEQQYRGLFENTLIGLYRSEFNGKITEINKILCQWHGFEEPQVELANETISHKIIRDYVSEEKHHEFREALLREGRVTSYTSEVRNHHTGKNMWISETAWLVKDEEGNPTHFEGSISDITEQVNNQSRIAYMALHDALTGLPNRAYLHDKLDEIIKSDSNHVAVHFLDLDRFKFVNDTFGHAVGDELLKQVAKRLSHCIRSGDFIARLGGDEFAIIQTAVYSDKEMEILAKRLIKTVAGSYRLGRHKAYIGTSIGISSMTQGSSETADDLLKKADAALYRAKGDGKGVYRFFDPQINGEMLKRRMIEADLRVAIKRKQMQVAYQPIICMKTGELYGYEALVRWRHPVMGYISPDIFITIAEECGEIDKIGEFVLQEACKQIAKNPKQLNISINVSAVQLRSYQFMNIVVQTLSESKLIPSQLTLEITETALITNSEMTREIINGLQNLGVKISLDDFGSGNASLSYLQKYKFDKIKIDRSYVSGTENLAMNKAILNAVTSLGRDLEIAIVAEGIETNDQHHKIAGYGCDFGQGYFYGKPKFAEDINELAFEAEVKERLRA